MFWLPVGLWDRRVAVVHTFCLLAVTMHLAISQDKDMIGVSNKVGIIIHVFIALLISTSLFVVSEFVLKRRSLLFGSKFATVIVSYIM